MDNKWYYVWVRGGCDRMVVGFTNEILRLTNLIPGPVETILCDKDCQ